MSLKSPLSPPEITQTPIVKDMTRDWREDPRFKYGHPFDRLSRLIELTTFGGGLAAWKIDIQLEMTSPATAVLCIAYRVPDRDNPFRLARPVYRRDIVFGLGFDPEQELDRALREIVDHERRESTRVGGRLLSDPHSEGA